MLIFLLWISIEIWSKRWIQKVDKVWFLNKIIVDIFDVIVDSENA